MFLRTLFLSIFYVLVWKLQILFSFFLFTGCAMSGLIADSRTMVDKARVEGQVGFFIQKLY